MAIRSFSQKHLSNDQIEQMYLAALSQVEAQIFEAHINLILSPDDEVSAKRMAKLISGLTALEAKYEAWVSSNPSADLTACEKLE